MRFEAQQQVRTAQAFRIAQADEKDYNAYMAKMEDLTHDILEEETVRPSDLNKYLG